MPAAVRCELIGLGDGGGDIGPRRDNYLLKLGVWRFVSDAL